MNNLFKLLTGTLLVSIFVFVLFSLIGCENNNPGPAANQDQQNPAAQSQADENTISQPVFKGADDTQSKQFDDDDKEAPASARQSADKADAADKSENNLTVMDVLKKAQTWEGAMLASSGKKVENFTVTDIKGKSHSLTDYADRNVLVIFWATWCPPCRAEIPHLKQLRSQIGEDKLAMIALSSEDEGIVKKFAKNNELNYSVAVSSGPFPSPLDQVQYLPTLAFIGPGNVFKTGAIGMMSEEHIKMMVEAEIK